MVPDRGIFVVADGMGGHAAGEVASEMAVRFVARELGSLKGLSDDQVADRMRAAIRAANGAIFQRTLTEHDKRGMGTTVTALVLYETRFLIDRKSTRLNSSHQIISYAVFCLKKKKIKVLLRDGLLNGDVLIVTCYTLSENL